MWQVCAMGRLARSVYLPIVHLMEQLLDKSLPFHYFRNDVSSFLHSFGGVNVKLLSEDRDTKIE